VKLAPAQVSVQSKAVGPDAIKLAEQAFTKHIPRGAIDALLYERTDVQLTRAQLEGHRHALKQRTLLSQNPGMTSADASNSTPADRLLSNLFASQTTSCIVLFGKCNTPLLTGTGAPPIQLIRKTRTGGVVTEDNVIGVDTPEVSAEAKLETALDHAERIRKSLSITGLKGIVD
jgi:hypothetical protein